MKVRVKKGAIEIDLTEEKSILFRVNNLSVTDLGISWYLSKGLSFISIDFVIVGITIVLK